MTPKVKTAMKIPTAKIKLALSRNLPKTAIKNKNQFEVNVCFIVFTSQKKQSRCLNLNK